MAIRPVSQVPEVQPAMIGFLAKGVAAAVSLAFFIPFCGEPRSPEHRPMTTHMEEAMDYRLRIETIALSAGDLTTPDDLLQYREFIDVYENPGPFQDAASALYADPEVAALQKEIAGYSMQRLPVDRLVQLGFHVADLADRQVVSASLLDRLVFPPLDWGTQLVENYERPDVMALMERLSRMDKLAETRREYIREQVLTGRARQDVLELRETGRMP